MNVGIKDIEEMNLTKTQEKILLYISMVGKEKIFIKELEEHVDVIYVTLYNELKKLVVNEILIINDNYIQLSDKGIKLSNYYKFKINILKEFCFKNNIDEELYMKFVESKYYNNLSLLIGIKNLLK